MSLNVAVCGAMGRMGRETVRAISEAEDLVLGPLIDVQSGGIEGRTVWADLEGAFAKYRPDVCVDFTHPEAAVANAEKCLEFGVACVIGTSGMGEPELKSLRAAAERTSLPILVVPNFAIGAVLMMRFAEEAARWMPEAAVLEMHHPGKADAPSGTAMHTADRIAAGRPTSFSRQSGTHLVKAEGALGGDVAGVPVHSMRLPGLVAHQMVVFGSLGETLTIRHDSLDRSSFMPGVLLAVREVRRLKGLTVGLEPLMFGK